MEPFEKLGAFYLGRHYDLAKGQTLDQPTMYDARDLTTHAVCVGMTGSGKTGLCIDLLEEAALDRVPAIVIDPKGDITNLLLTFPELRPQDFAPWINPDDARRKGMTVEEYARQISKTWSEGLAGWSQGAERIQALKDSAEFRICTPGSDAGLPVSILASLKAPALSWDDEAELLREQIQGTASALLGLAGVEADPLQSREHILLATIFEHFWRQGRDLDLAGLISSIQTPPVQKLGVFDIDTFFPPKDRFGLAMSLNNILAAPGFATWLQGEPLDVASLLYGPGGRPRLSIFTISHLGDAERMFFVTLLLEQIVTWMRRQSGTTSLRALLYFDEVYGFLPPVANPPSKRPLLTLLKQARAFGLGVMLTTQNPVDLDYKSLTNAGTWFIGKLQADRDKARLLDGLESVSKGGGQLDRSQMDRIISGLGSRVFLLHNVHEDQPAVFQTRWAMSYLRGPLTRSQIRQLKAGAAARTAEASAPAAGPTSPDVAPATSQTAVRRDVVPIAPAVADPTGAPSAASSTPPAVPPDIKQVYLPLTVSEGGAIAQLEKEAGQPIDMTQSSLLYEPSLLLLGRVGFVDRRRKVNQRKQVGCLVPVEDLDGVVSWADAEAVELDPAAVRKKPEPAASFAPLPAGAAKASALKSLAKDFSDYLYHEERLELQHCPALKLYSEPGETERDFHARAQQAARELRDAEVEKLRRKYDRQLARLQTRLAREQQELEEDRADYSARKREEVISAGETLIGMLGVFGRKRSTGLSTAARKRRMTAKAKQDIAESQQEIARLQEEIEELRQQMQQDAGAIAEKWDAALDDMETFPVKPRRSDVKVVLAALVWAPGWEIGYQTAAGRTACDRVPAWTSGA